MQRVLIAIFMLAVILVIAKLAIAYGANILFGFGVDVPISIHGSPRATILLYLFGIPLVILSGILLLLRLARKL
jgi:hypothetical protein